MIYDKVMYKLRIADVKGSVIKVAIKETMIQIQKEMGLINQSAIVGQPELFYVISKEKWEDLKNV